MTFQQLWLLSLKDRPRNFATSKIIVLRQEWKFFSFFIYYYRREIFLQCGRVSGSVFGLWRVCFLACQEQPAGAYWKRLLSTQACSTYVYLKKKLRKLQKHLRRGLFCENCRITDQTKASLSEIQHRHFVRNLLTVLIVALKNKKSYHEDMK